MTRYQCTCMAENGEKYCPVHRKKMNRRNFYKQEDNQYKLKEDKEGDE